MSSKTIKDVALEAGVSTATISRVLNKKGYVSQTVRLHVEQVMKRMNYQPNALASSLKRLRTRTIGIILPDMTNTYFMIVARRIQKRLMEKGFHLIYMDSEEKPEKELEAIQLFQSMRVEGIIVAGTGENAGILRHLMEMGTAVILLDRKIDGVHTDLVVEDNAAASEEAIAYLLDKYGPHVGFIGGPSTISTAKERLSGLYSAYASKGQRLSPELVFEGDYSRASGVQASHFFMDRDHPPTAIFSANNEMTVGFYLGLKEKGIALDQVEVVSFGEFDASVFIDERLSVIYQNPLLIGEAVAELTLKQVGRTCEERETMRFTPRFEKRFS